MMADPAKIIRTDGTKVTLPKHPSWKTEFYNLYAALINDPWIVFLFPMFFASNYFYTWRESISPATRGYDKLNIIDATRTK
jgi:hypothetical protein